MKDWRLVFAIRRINMLSIVAIADPVCGLWNGRVKAFIFRYASGNKDRLPVIERLLPKWGVEQGEENQCNCLKREYHFEGSP